LTEINVDQLGLLTNPVKSLGLKQNLLDEY